MYIDVALSIMPWGIMVRVAEGEGFEPPDLSVNGFQDRRLRPLGHPSIGNASCKITLCQDQILSPICG